MNIIISVYKSRVLYSAIVIERVKMEILRIVATVLFCLLFKGLSIVTGAPNIVLIRYTPDFFVEPSPDCSTFVPIICICNSFCVLFRICITTFISEHYRTF